MPDAEFTNWFPGQVSECASRLEPGLVERGKTLSPDDDQAGEQEAEEFIESLTVPDCPKRCARLFPRMWAAQRTVDRAILRPKLRVWEELDRVEVLRVLLVLTWPNHGKRKWEQDRPDGFKFG